MDRKHYMDSYSVCRLYHQALTLWWEDTDNKDYMIPIKDVNLSSILIQLCKQYPPNVILLLATDGRITTISKLEDAPPPDFRVRRHMKIDNRSSVASIKNVINVLYQLLSMTIEDNHISLLDFIGLLKFLILVQTENSSIDYSSTEIIMYIRKQFYDTPDFLKSTTINWKKLYRDPLLDQFYQTYQERNYLTSHANMLDKIQSCHRMIEKLCATISLQEERISWLEGSIPTEPDQDTKDNL